jgi:hypothetical protein
MFVLMVTVFLALIAALVACLLLYAWDVVTSDQFHWVILFIVTAFILQDIWRSSQVPIAWPS